MGTPDLTSLTQIADYLDLQKAGLPWKFDANDCQKDRGEVSGIVVDWGRQDLRVWALNESQEVLFMKHSLDGSSTLSTDEYEPLLMKIIGRWLPPTVKQPLQIWISGTAGCKNGWQDAGYAKMPVRLDALPSRAVAVEVSDPRIEVHILPGLCQYSHHTPDVMRGEETLLLGLWDIEAIYSGLVLMPGEINNKWIELHDGRAMLSRTHVTHELFEAICQHTSLRQSVDVDVVDDQDGFEEGLKAARDTESAALSNLYNIRARSLLYDVSTAWSTAYLRGLLIGSEIREETCGINVDGAPHVHRSVTLLGSDVHAERYDRALQYLGYAVKRVDADVARLRGLCFALNQNYCPIEQPDMVAFG
ncbi:MAG: 2-dehydro-3-deoxygalactonokinase [Cohaesibacteraceae bacterium]|nr:2-dehydro-3-deoxygalactonokinase [Cohaesibacteraceae bacterium]